MNAVLMHSIGSVEPTAMDLNDFACLVEEACAGGRAGDEPHAAQ